MIIGCDIFSELKIDLCFSYNIIGVNGGAHRGCMDTIKYRSKINFNASYNCSKDKIFWNE